MDSCIISAIVIAAISTTCLGEENIHQNVINENNRGRFLTFNNDASNIRLEIVFAVPFLHIPIGASIQNGGPRPIVDINAKSLVVASVILFMLLFVIPGLVRHLIPAPPLHFGYTGAEARSFLERMENSMANLGIDSGECWRKGVCTMVTTAVENVASGKASSWEKIIDGMTQYARSSMFIASRISALAGFWTLHIGERVLELGHV